MSHRRSRPWSSVLLFALAFTPFGQGEEEGARPPAAAAATEDAFVCPPCSVDCHDRTYDAPGNCALCGMELVPASSVPNVAILLVEGVDLLSVAGPLGVLAASSEARVFTVADTTDPIRSRDGLELLPAFEMGTEPEADVLILPSVVTATWDDELVMGWIERTAARADHVCAIGTGALVAAKAGLTDDLAIPVSAGLAGYLAERFPDVELVEDRGITSGAKTLLARDAAGGMEIAVRVLARMSGEEIAARTAAKLGLR